MTRAGSLALLVLFPLTACAGEAEDGVDPTPGEAFEDPSSAVPPVSAVDWFLVDDGARTVTLRLEAGATPANQRWNFNGYFNGNATVTVPEGYSVTVHFVNSDSVVTHSVGVDERTGSFPPNMSRPFPAFPGALSSNPLSIDDATPPGGEETFTFVAERAGRYSLVCYIPGHAVTGMWIHFHVSDDGSSGVITP